MKYKVGDTVRIIDNVYGHRFDIGSLLTIEEADRSSPRLPYMSEGDWFGDSEVELVDTSEVRSTVTANGGATSYYDMPFGGWVTTNDMMEHLAEHKWGKYGIHLKDIFKGLCRWGDKDGTTIEYDTRKIIYYGVRVLRMLKGNEGVREYLKELMEDKQFN